MKLTSKQIALLIQHLQRHWKEPETCPICHEEAWKVPPFILELSEYEEGELIAYLELAMKRSN